MAQERAKEERKVSRWFLILLTLCFCLTTLPSSANTYQLGDVFVAVGNGKVQHRDAAGRLLETLDTLKPSFTTGMAFDSLGNLYVTNFGAGTVSRFNNSGGLIGTFGSGYNGSPESIVFDRNGNAYVGAVNGDNRIRKFDPMGNPLTQFTVATESRGTDWIDLGADQCTMFYTSESANIKRFNVCTNAQLTNFNAMPLPGSAAFALRILPTGGLLVANTSVIARLDSSGNLTQVYDAPGENCWFALNLDPDGKSFWSADFCSSNIYKFDIQTGQQLLTLNTGTTTFTVFGVAIFGEIAVGAPSALHATVGNQRVYLYWDPAPEPVDGYNIFVARFDTSTNTFIQLGKINPSGVLIQGNSFRVFSFANGEFPQNGQLYRFTLAAVKNGVEGPPSNFVLARPGEFAVSQPPPKPANPILFLHGIASGASTWDITRDFLTNTVRWTFGGNLSYRSFQSPASVDPRTTDPNLSAGFDPGGNFFTVDFGDNLANYSDHRGLLHQADEVQGFLRTLRARGLSQRIAFVAHSMGGMAARSFIADNPKDASDEVFQFTTYGSPHWGASYAGIVQGASDGARNLNFNCTNGRLDYSGSSFLEHLRNTQLPDKLRYFLIRGHNDFPRHRVLTGGCLSIHWDGVIPLDSADLSVPQTAPLGQVSLTTNPVGLLTTNRFHTNQTNDFSAILCAFDLNCFILSARSPVVLEITAPDGRHVAPQLEEIPGASYTELEDALSHPITAIVIPFVLGGDYTIRVLPKPGAAPTDTYTLEVTRAGVATIVAQDQRVQDIPVQPYVVAVLPPLRIDIKPGSFPNSINPKSEGRIPVAILSTPAFNAPSRVKPASLTFGRTGNEASLAFCSGPEDVNGDGLLDLVCHFSTQQAGFLVGDTQGVLQGKTIEGIPFVGTDSVRIVP